MSPLLSTGVELMLIGMGTVFFFLSLLVIASGVMSRIAQRFLPAGSLYGPMALVQDEEIAAIASAIQLHQRR